MRKSRGHHLIVFVIGAAAVFAIAAVIMWGLAGLLRSARPEGAATRILLAMASMVLACFVAAWGFAALARAMGLLGLIGQARAFTSADGREMQELVNRYRQTIPTPEMIRERLLSLRDSPQLLDVWKERYRLMADYAKKQHLHNCKQYEEACNSV